MDLKEVVVNAILEKKGMDVICYDCSELTPFMEYMVIASTMNIRQNNAIAQNIKDRVKENGFTIDIRMEGDAHSKWLLVDLKDIVVHLFVKEERGIYRLDRLYQDCPREEYDV